VILQNGLIRTLDPQIPTQRALAIAGGLIAGGVGVHETALASPEVLDLGGRVVLPGFSDAHVHFPTWAMAQNEVNLDGCGSLDEALERLRGVPKPERGRWLRGYGWRSGDWSPQREPTRRDLDPITGDSPAQLRRAGARRR
jgi:predicted amidohydrolase YtcJ